MARGGYKVAGAASPATGTGGIPWTMKEMTEQKMFVFTTQNLRKERESYATPFELGDVMTGESVAKVLTSKHPDYAEGDIVVALTGWRTHALSDGIGLYGTALRKLDPAVPPVTAALGVLGMPRTCGARTRCAT